MKRPYHFLLILLALLTTSAGCTEQFIDKEPVVHLVIQGDIIDAEERTPIAGIEVTPCSLDYVSSSNGQLGEPGYTDKDGSFRLEVTTYPWMAISLEIKDVDGPANGGDYRDVIMTIPTQYRYNSLEETDDTWDFGTVSVLVYSILMNHKEES